MTTVDLMTEVTLHHAQSLTHHRCIFVSKQVTSFELRTTDCLESKLTSFEFSLEKWDWVVSCVGNVWKCLSDVRSHILTAVVTARVSANNRTHNANHSTEVEWDASGWMTDLNALRSDCSCTDTVSCSELFIHFKAFWACLVVIDTTDNAHGAHCRAWRSPGRRTQREREERKR